MRLPFQIDERHGLAEEIALTEEDTERTYLFDLCRGLDAFRNDRQIEGSGKLNDRCQDRDRLGTIDPVDERLVDLDLVELKGGQIGQRRIANAEIVERNGDAELLQALQGLQILLAVGQEHALGDR